MSHVKLLNENIDNISNLWLPDPELCTAQDELRRIEEWKRKTGGSKLPSELGIESYRYGNTLPAKFFEGRNPPPVALDSAENLEWYVEQLHRCIYGFEYKGYRVTGDYYWFLNFTPFLISEKGEDGDVTTNFKIDFPYFSYQHDYIFKLIEEAHSFGKKFMMMGGRAYGKSLVDSELVMSPDGKVTNGSLKVGDTIYGSAGSQIKITGVYPQGKLDVYEVILKDGRSVKCSLDHLWGVFLGDGKYKVLSTGDMINDFETNRDNGKIHKYYIPTGNGADYSEKYYTIHPYTLGVLLGDGSLGKYGTRLALAEGEEEILDRIVELEKLTLNKDYSNNYNLPPNGTKVMNRVFFKVNSCITSALKALNLNGVHTFDKFIPKEYMFGSRDQRMDLLRGLMDTDGYCSKNGKIEFTNTSKSLAEDVLDLARSLGIKSNITVAHRNDNINAHTQYRVRLFTDKPIFHLKRKLVNLNTAPNKRIQRHRDRTAIVNITKLDYKEHCTCISVDADDSLYLTNGYTLTHNTYMILSILAKNYYLKPESHNIVSASNSKHSSEAFSKLKRMLLAIDKAHPTLALARLVDTKYLVKSGYEVNIDGVKREEGPMSVIQEVVYGDNPGVTRGWRPDTQLLEECMAPGTKVLMSDKTFKNIEDIRVGDKIYTSAFLKRRVGRITSGVAEMYRITQSVGKPYIVNGKHRLRLSYYDEFGDMNYVNIRAEDFAKRDDQDCFYGVRIDRKRPDVQIESIGEGEYYGFTVESEDPNDHLFVLNDGTVTHNCGDWSTGKANLKECLTASEGSWVIGGIKKCRVFLVGTGGSVSSDQAKDIFVSPDVNNILSVNDFPIKAGKKHAVFIPADYLYGGAGWERTGVNNNLYARETLEYQRMLKEDDVQIRDRYIQEFPFTIEEVFRKSGTNIFNQRNISKQWSDIQFGADNIVKPEKGYLEWKRSAEGKILGVTWSLNPNGNIEIVEHPYHGKNKNVIYPDLYVAGVDSIDQGVLDSTTSKNRSSLAMLIKKRIVDGEYFQQTSNIYVAKYIGRSLDVRDDYEEVLKLTMYYSATVNIEYTKIGIRQYFIERKQFHRLMKRPMIARSSVGSGDNEYINKLREQSLIGTTTAENVIDYGDGKIKEYTRDYCQNIFFVDLLEQLRDYQRENRTKFDLVVAMALCEIADEDLLGIPAKSNDSASRELQDFGFYTDEKGIKHRGVIPVVKRVVTDSFKESTNNGFRWIDMKGNPRFDDNFNILDINDLKSSNY